MVNRIAVLAVALAALAAADCSAGTPKRPFPLRDGNRWTLLDVATGARSRLAVQREASRLVLRGFPGAGALRVRPRGAAVEAWDERDRRWEPFLRLGARAGTTYRVDLGQEVLWQNVTVVVRSRTASVHDATDTVHSGCVVLRFRAARPIADAGVEEIAFAPGVGPVRVVETTIAGPRARLLESFRT